jgi:hypothetical protein
VRGDDGVARADDAAAICDNPSRSGRDIDVLRTAHARMLCYVLPMTIEEMRHETDHHRGMRGRGLGHDRDGC